MLNVADLRTGYGRSQVLHGINLGVGERQVVAILGPNGAGKSTFLRTIAGVHRQYSGSIEWQGEKLGRSASSGFVSKGISMVPEGRQIFASMTIRENLLMGAFSRRDEEIPDDLERMYEMFPILRERANSPGSALSGGQQQMLAIARGLMARPRLLLLDEPSLGLAPIIMDEQLRPLILSLPEQFDTSVLLVEQNVFFALEVSSYSYFFHSGVITVEGQPDEMAERLSKENLFLSAH